MKNRQTKRKNPIKIPPSWYHTEIILYTGHVYFEGVLTSSIIGGKIYYRVKQVQGAITALFNENDIYTIELKGAQFIVLKDYYELHHMPPPLRD